VRHVSAGTLHITSAINFVLFSDASGAVIGGEWSSRGCSLVSTNSTLSVCECNHLTHFATLLSPRLQKVSIPHECMFTHLDTCKNHLQISKENAIALSMIGYVGVSVSIVSLGMTVLILICVK
jgi:hypothetical protein